MVMRLAVFPGAEWFFPGAAKANQSFRQYLQTQLRQRGYSVEESLFWNCLPKEGKAIAIGFSIGAMRLTLVRDERLTARIAIDGWCVPFSGEVPTYRLSHDWDTHLNGYAFGKGLAQFYAEPPVTHLDLWKNPQNVSGWYLEREQKERITAHELLWQLINEHTVESTVD